MQEGHRQTNPVFYAANYFGGKVQNEKLVLFGVTHVCAVDEYSGKLLVLASWHIRTMP